MQHPEHLHAGGELLIMPSYQVEIPRTTPQLYITGIHALNVQCPEGTTGDQHDVFHWFYRPGIREEAPTVTLGGSDELDTNAIYGDLGVYEGRERLLAKGLNIAPEIREVYVANHYRAILDLLYESLTHYGRVYNLTGATGDWLDTPEQRRFVLEQATRMAPYVDEESRIQLEQWVKKEAAGTPYPTP